ncbi:MAG TPA: glycosyltransferase family 2 protein [Acidimicrobiales bacterium]|nr:glycosyltransferase family 2 protein [Acidimicrobiales bacterium]
MNDGENVAASVTVAIPALDVAQQVEECLAAVEAQSCPGVVEILVVDGGSQDRTREVAARHARVRIVDNPRRSRPAAMNVAIREARGDVVVRVDARTTIAPDYVERCVAALERTGAAIVGGPMRLGATTPRERGVRAAMTSRLGGGPAAFRRDAGTARFVDTVYLGAFRRDVVAGLGGYDETFGGNEDAELAYRARSAGGVFLDPAIRSTYAVRGGPRELASQYFRYGRARARTIRKHPASLAPRQLAVPLLMLGLASPWRRIVLTCYTAAVVSRSALEATKDPAAAPWLAVALPTMHGAWGAGFVRGIAGARRQERRTREHASSFSSSQPLTRSETKRVNST